MGHRVLQLLPLSESAANQNSPYSAIAVFSIDPLYISVAGLAGVPTTTLNVPALRLCAGGGFPGRSCGP